MGQGLKEQIGTFPHFCFRPTKELHASVRIPLLNAGPETLTDYELLEMTLVRALPRRAIKPIARALLVSFGTYSNVLAASVPELLRIDGLGEAGAAALKLVHAAALRLVRAEVRDQPVFSNWDKLMDYLNAALAREKVEQLRVLFLDGRNRLLGDEIISRGTINHTAVYPRQVLVRALELHAAALILVHNHPSGDPTPSGDDIAMTDDVRRAAAPLDIVVYDHVIIGNGRWTSFRKEGLLK
jgi:DNA repair protein RadC